MPDDKRQFLGLNTDSPPDRLGDQLFRVENLVPRSPTSAAVRPGVSLVGHYQPTSAGRVIVADALPGAPGAGFLLVVVNSGGQAAKTWQVDGLFAFRPSSAAPLAAGGGAGGGTGITSDTVIFGAVQ